MELLHYQNLLPDETVDLTSQAPYGTKTYNLDWHHRTIAGFTQGVDGVNQRVYKILATERGAFPIYSEDYGVAVDDLRGKDYDLVASELKRRITLALEGDSEITYLDDFDFSRDNDDVYLVFRLGTVYSEVEEIEWRFTGL